MVASGDPVNTRSDSRQTTVKSLPSLSFAGRSVVVEWVGYLMHEVGDCFLVYVILTHQSHCNTTAVNYGQYVFYIIVSVVFVVAAQKLPSNASSIGLTN